ncbi:polyprenol phosphomannose-dependent alpha 1,6 mannosyltransferase MptB [Parenemella sanctibonifatiensis]|uniref:DUF2029 domain-containing protein n=1 Tax=Parenemella sanctibonifatiensis TaxID=2016505 RepID=A0A255EBQ8_9ACTN|nr:polyprenol phosphomannose-dependent alpha 1,6 mannosyltransferase MptB [Parenemella sanctibonifatiensis]OYN88998.1 hypothetical protein CGZ91_12025 [Parenemella sanctibonifatiensis]
MTDQGLLRRWGAELSAAWRLTPVKRGFFGAVLIVLGSLTPAFLPQASPWWTVLNVLHLASTPGTILGTVAALAGIGLLIDGWFGLRPARGQDVNPVAVLIIWSLPFLLAPPIFSHDAYSYAAQGWLVRNGLNPYDVGPGTLPGTFADQVPTVWRYTPAPYGPLSLQIAHLMVILTFNQPYLAGMMMRIPALIGVALIVVFLPKIGRRIHADQRLIGWAAILNPVLITDFVGGAHNDSLQVGLVVFALWLAMDKRLVWAAIVVGVATAVKQPALLAAFPIGILCSTWRGWRPRAFLPVLGRCALVTLIAVATFVVISLACGLGFGWINAAGVPGSVTTVSPATVVGTVIQWVLNLLNLDPTGSVAVRWSRTIGMAIAALIVIWLAFRVAPKRPITFLAWAYIVIALGVPALHGWYMLWGGVLLPLTKLSTRMVRVIGWASVALLAYNAISLAGRNGWWALGVAAAAVLVWQVTHHERLVKNVANPDETATRRDSPVPSGDDAGEPDRSAEAQ